MTGGYYTKARHEALLEVLHSMAPGLHSTLYCCKAPMGGSEGVPAGPESMFLKAQMEPP